jgi:hypothetical protein
VISLFNLRSGQPQPCLFTLYRSVNGGPFTNAGGSSQPLLFDDVPINQTYQYAVSTQSVCNGPASTRAIGPKFVPTVKDDTVLTYTGSWKRVSERGEWNGGYHVTKTTGSVSYSGPMANVAWVYGDPSDYGGIANVYIDGVKKATLKPLTDGQGQAIFKAGWAKQGRHNIKITVVKGPISIDDLEIITMRGSHDEVSTEAVLQPTRTSPPSNRGAGRQNSSTTPTSEQANSSSTSRRSAHRRIRRPLGSMYRQDSDPTSGCPYIPLDGQRCSRSPCSFRKP